MASAERTQASQTRGDTEQEFKNWSERFTTYMANAGDKVWRKILKALQVMGNDDDSLDDVNDVKQVLKQVGVGQQLVEELQDALYDQSAYSVHKGRIAGRHPNCRAWHAEEDCRECPQGAETC